MKQALFRIIIALLPVLYASVGYSQLSGCNNAQNACANPGFQLTGGGGSGLPGNLNISNPNTNPQNGNGANPAAPFPNSGCLLSNGPGPNWMVLTVSTTGMLGFAFGASSSLPGTFPQSGLYDWAMWAYNPTTCANIFNNTLPPVACNWNGSSQGGTGMGAPTQSAVSSTGVILPPGDPSNFQPSIPVTAGDQFIILLSNFSGVTNSVTISRTGSAEISCSPLILPSFIRCPGQQAVMTATWAANVTNVSYTLASAMPLTIANSTVQANPTFVVAPTSTHVYTVFAAGTNTLNAVITTSNTFTVTISPTTTMNVAATNSLNAMNNGNVCYGQSATFTAQSAGTNYTLTGPPGTPPVYSAIPVMTTPTLSANASYTMATTLFSGCTATGAVNVNVGPNDPIVTNAPLNVCLSGEALLTATVPLAGSYSWSGPNSYTSAIRTPTITNIPLTASGVYTVNASLNFNNITCPATATTAVTVIPTSPVAISASPARTLCQGSSLHLSSSITGTASFLWQGPNNFNASAQTTTVSNLVPASSGIYTTTAIFSNAYASCPITNTVQIAIIATAVPTISLPSNICQHSTAQLSVTTGGIETPSILWQGPASFSSSLFAPVISSITPNASGVYDVYAYYTGGFSGATVCPTHASAQMNVVPVNTISIIAPPPTCRPNDVIIYSSAVGAISYDWAGPNGFTDHQANPILSHPNINATGVYTVTVAFGGGALVCYNTNTVTVTVNPVLNFSLSMVYPNRGNIEIAPGSPVCYNEAVRILGPSGATSYSWTSSSGYVSGSQNAEIPVTSPADEGDYNLSVALGECITSQSINLRVLSRIEPLYMQQSTTVCKGDRITLKSQVTGGSGSNDPLAGESNYGYTWVPDVYLNSRYGSIQNTKPLLGTTIYNVIAYDNACPSYSITHTFTVNVLEAAKPKLELEKTQGCGPLCLFYDSKIEQNKSIVTYDFIGSNGNSRRFQNDAFTYCLEDAGSYTLRIRSTTLFENDQVCTDSTDYPAPIVVYPKPGSDISWFPESPTISENNVTFTSNSKNGSVVSQKWNFTGTYNDTTDVIAPRRLFEYTGRYQVMYTATNDLGCTDTIIKFIDIKDDFNVYIPNSFTPNGDNLNDVFQMKGTGVKPDAFTMDVFDRWGSLLFSTKDPAKGWDGTAKGQQLGEGVYVYKIKLSGANGEGKKEYLGQVTLIR